jgi:hypothetical protein
MSSAAFVDSLDQWRFARAHLPADCLLATADMEVEVEARREGRIVTSLWQGIDVADTSRNFERSRQVCELVGETLRQRLAPRYVGLADFVKWDIRNSALYVLNSYTVVERCLARAEPTQAWVFPEMAKSVFYDPIDHPCDLFNAVAAVSARRVGCEVTILPPLPPVSEGSSRRTGDRPTHPGGTALWGGGRSRWWTSFPAWAGRSRIC